MVNYQKNNKDEFKKNFIKYQDSRTKREYFFKGVCLASEHKISRKISPYPWLFNLFYTVKRKYLSLYNREREDTHELTHSPAPSLIYLHYPLPLILSLSTIYFKVIKQVCTNKHAGLLVY